MLGLTKIAPGRENVGLTDRPEPVAGAGQVVLAVEAAGICGTDIHIVDDEFRSSPPVTMGHEVCGVVAAIGAGVDPGWLGARVVSETYFSTCGRCGSCRAGRANLCLERQSIGSAVDGAFAPRLLIPAHGLHLVPERLSSAAASMAEPLACVCHCLLDPAAVCPGDEVLVAGPGPIGLLAAQVARACGASVHVRGVAGRDDARLAVARELALEVSADGDLTGRMFDVVVECSGSAGGIDTCLRHARRGGRYVQVGLAGAAVRIPFDEVCFRELTVTGGNASTPASWRRGLRLVEQRRVELELLVSEVVPLGRWQRALAAARAGTALKIVLDPR